MLGILPLALITSWLFLLFPLQATAGNEWVLQPGSTFYDASTQSTQSLEGTVATEVAELATYWRHTITELAITGNSMRFVEASFGGGTIDINKEKSLIGPVHFIIGNPDYSRFTRADDASVAFTGPADAPTSITITNLSPYEVGPHDLDSGDRLTLVLEPKTADAKPSCRPVSGDSERAFLCDFLVELTWNKRTHVFSANFTLPALGEFGGLTLLNVYRDHENVRDVSMTGLTFVRDEKRKRVRLVLHVWDPNDQLGKLEHFIAGRLLLRPDRNR